MVIGRSTDFHSFFFQVRTSLVRAPDEFGLFGGEMLYFEAKYIPRYGQATSSLSVSVPPISFFTLAVFSVFSSVAICPKEDPFVPLKQGAYQDCS